MITTAIKSAFQKKKARNWEIIFFAIDIHDTIVKSNYETGNIPTEFYPYAKEALIKLTARKDIKLIMYTCSHPHEILSSSRGMVFISISLMRTLMYQQILMVMVTMIRSHISTHCSMIRLDSTLRGNGLM